MRGLGLKEVLNAPRSPWQNGYVERLIGSIRRECLDHVIVMNEQHLRRILHSYFDYYHRTRTHLSVGKDAPVAIFFPFRSTDKFDIGQLPDLFEQPFFRAVKMDNQPEVPRQVGRPLRRQQSLSSARARGHARPRLLVGYRLRERDERFHTQSGELIVERSMTTALVPAVRSSALSPDVLSSPDKVRPSASVT